MNNRPDYSVRVKNGAGWRLFKRVRLMISVGQQYHEGGKMEAVVEWINRNPSIEEVHISVNDYLQRHNYYARGFSCERADAIALSEGTLWIERNQDILSGIRVKSHIGRWNDWHHTTVYQSARAALDRFAGDDSDFAQVIQGDASMLAARKLNRGEEIPASLVEHSAEYLREELTVFAIQSAMLPAAEIYPGSNLASAEYLQERILPNEIAAMADRYFTRIDFARINVQLPAPATGHAPHALTTAA